MLIKLKKLYRNLIKLTSEKSRKELTSFSELK